MSYFRLPYVAGESGYCPGESVCSKSRKPQKMAKYVTENLNNPPKAEIELNKILNALNMVCYVVNSCGRKIY